VITPESSRRYEIAIRVISGLASSDCYRDVRCTSVGNAMRVLLPQRKPALNVPIVSHAWSD
jgi:hypothetical protein